MGEINHLNEIIAAPALPQKSMTGPAVILYCIQINYLNNTEENMTNKAEKEPRLYVEFRSHLLHMHPPVDDPR